MAKKLEDLIAGAVSTIGSSAPKEAAPTLQDVQEAPEAPKEAAPKPEGIPAPEYPRFSLRAARNSILARIEVEEMRESLRAKWEAAPKKCKTGRKAVGSLTDYHRATFIVSSSQLDRLRRLAEDEGISLKEVVEYTFEAGLTVISNSKK